MYELCPLYGCIYNDDGICEYEYAPWQDPYSCDCYDEQYDENMMEE